jgi:hypothetical protein
VGGGSRSPRGEVNEDPAVAYEQRKMEAITVHVWG